MPAKVPQCALREITNIVMSIQAVFENVVGANETKCSIDGDYKCFAIESQAMEGKLTVFAFPVQKP